MTHWWKSMGTRVGMEHVQEWPHVQLSTSHTHINISTCGVLRSVVVIGFQMQSGWLAPHIGIFMWVWLVDSWTWGHSWTCSIPIPLSPYFFTSESSLHFLIFFNVLVWSKADPCNTDKYTISFPFWTVPFFFDEKERKKKKNDEQFCVGGNNAF